MGTDIRRRTLSSFPSRARIFNANTGTWMLPQISDFAADIGCFEETTSHRTGRSLEQGRDRDDDAALAAATKGDQFAALQREYRDQASSPTDTGHPFSSVKRTVDMSPYVLHESYDHIRNEWTVFEGFFREDPYQWNEPLQGFDHFNWPQAPDFSPILKGQEAIAATRPTAPAANLAQSLIELRREGIPHMLQLDPSMGNRDLLNQAAHGHLSSEFGVEPLIRDLQQTAKTVSRSRDILQQYLRDSGKVVRRRYRFPTERVSHSYPPKVGTITPVTSTGGVRPFLRDGDPVAGGWNNVQSCTALMTETVTVERRTWFSGAYTYHLPVDKGIVNKVNLLAAKANKLYGVRLTPDLLWELAPWSWLVDWNTNIGPLISNLVSFGNDELVLKYGYLMTTEIATRDIVLTTPDHTLVSHGMSNQPIGFRGPYRISYKSVRKDRVRANPYGFSLSIGDYTGRQWSILGALGLTKAPEALRQDSKPKRKGPRKRVSSTSRKGRASTG